MHQQNISKLELALHNHEFADTHAYLVFFITLVYSVVDIFLYDLKYSVKLTETILK
jgi:hypothetical protein